MKLPLALLATSLLIAGCSHSYQVQDDPKSWYPFESVNKELKGQDVRLLFIDARLDSGTIVSLAKDTTSYVRRSTTEILRVQTSSLRLIQFEHAGTWDGAGVGAAIVGGGTLILGLAVAATTNTDFPVGILVAVGATAGVIVGGVVGLVVGSTTTSVDTYLLSPEEEK